MRDHHVRIDHAPVQVVDRQRVAVRPEVRAVHGQLLAIADHGPVGGDLRAEHPEDDHRAQLAQRGETLLDRGGVAGGFDEHVAAVAARELLDACGGVLRRHVDGDVGAEAPGDLETLGLGVGDHDATGVLELDHLQHQQPEGAGAGQHDGVAESNLTAFDGVDGAGERLDQDARLGGHVGRHLMHPRVRVEAHVLGPGAVGDAFLKTVDVVPFAHPVLARAAVPALAAGHDLLGDGLVADLEAMRLRGAIPELDDGAEELVARDDGSLDPGIVAPEHGPAGVALAVGPTDACGVDADDHLARAGVRPRNGLETVVLRAVVHDRGHGVAHGQASTRDVDTERVT